MAAAASRVQGVTSVLTAEDVSMDHQQAEAAAELVAAMQQRYAPVLLSLPYHYQGRPIAVCAPFWASGARARLIWKEANDSIQIMSRLYLGGS